MNRIITVKGTGSVKVKPDLIVITMSLESQHLDYNRTMKLAAEAVETLQKAIQSLPEKQKLVFTMRYYDDLPYEEISKILDMSVGTLKTNYHYAKQKVEVYIKANYTE